MDSTGSMTAQVNHRVVEFFSGIGGMHYAALYCASNTNGGVQVEVAAALDNNQTANRVYAHNLGADPLQLSIEHLTVEQLERFDADTWLMSPPCQPYTRLGQQRDMADPRAKALLHLCSLLQQMKRPPTYFLLENVYGFDQSDSRQVLLHTLASVGYQVQEFLLQPWQFGIPNERLRYYCLAVRAPAQPLRPHQGDVPQPLDHIPGMDMPRWRDAQVPSYPRQAEGIPTQTYSDFDKQRGACYYWCPTLREYLSTNQPIESGELDAPTNDDYSVPLRELANANSFVFDIVSMDSRISACFTRGYGKHYRGSGSFLSPVLHTDAAHITPSSDRFIEDLQALKLRRFSPMEVATLQGLPPPQAAGREPSARGHFSFPQAPLPWEHTSC